MNGAAPLPLSAHDLEALGRHAGRIEARAQEICSAALKAAGLLVPVPRGVLAARLAEVACGRGGGAAAETAAEQMEAAGVTAAQVVLLWGQMLEGALRESAEPACSHALVRSFANESAAAVEACRRAAAQRFSEGFQATLSSRAGVERLLSVVRDVVGETSASALFGRIARGAAALARGDAAFLWELDRDGRTLRIVAAEGVPPASVASLQCAVGEGFMGSAAAKGTLVEGDLRGDPRAGGRGMMDEYRSAVALPLRAKGAIVGVLGVVRRSTGAFVEEEKKFLLTLGAYAGSLMELNRLYWESVGAQQSLRRLQEIAHDMVEALAEPTLLQRIVSGASELAHSERAILWTMDAEGRRFVPVAWHGVPDPEAESLILGIHEGTLGEVVRTRAPVETDLSTDPRVPNRKEVERKGLRGSVRVPVIFRGEVRGVLGVATTRARRYTREEIDALHTLASYVASALETSKLYRAALESRSAWEATFDSINDLALLVSPEGVVRRANRALCKRLATTPEGLVGRTLGEVLGSGPGSRDVARIVLSTYASTSYEGELPRLPGTVFHVRAAPVQTDGGVILGVLVLVRETASAPAKSGTSEDPTTSRFQVPRGLRILVVDEEPSAVESVRGVLGDANTIVSVEDGVAAVQALRNERFDLVITDMRMPGLGGRELYRFIVREKPELTERVVFTTTAALSTDTHEFLRDFSIPTLEKPLAARDVLKSVIQALNAR